MNRETQCKAFQSLTIIGVLLLIVKAFGFSFTPPIGLTEPLHVELNTHAMEEEYKRGLEEPRSNKDEESMRRFELEMEKGRLDHEQRMREMDQLMKEAKNAENLFPNRSKDEEVDFYKSCENALRERRKTKDWSNE
jgi:hypothetical protein